MKSFQYLAKKSKIDALSIFPVFHKEYNLSCFRFEEQPEKISPLYVYVDDRETELKAIQPASYERIILSILAGEIVGLTLTTGHFPARKNVVH